MNQRDIFHFRINNFYHLMEMLQYKLYDEHNFLSYYHSKFPLALARGQLLYTVLIAS